MSYTTTSQAYKKSQRFCTNMHPNTLFLNHYPQPAMGAHTRSKQAAVKWGPVWELLAGLVETAKA